MLNPKLMQIAWSPFLKWIGHVVCWQTDYWLIAIYIHLSIKLTHHFRILSKMGFATKHPSRKWVEHRFEDIRTNIRHRLLISNIPMEKLHWMQLILQVKQKWWAIICLIELLPYSLSVILSCFNQISQMEIFLQKSSPRIKFRQAIDDRL